MRVYFFREIFAEFRKITNKPVAAIIYTHFHADHISGIVVVDVVVVVVVPPLFF